MARLMRGGELSSKIVLSVKEETGDHRHSAQEYRDFGKENGGGWGDKSSEFGVRSSE
jgi:hypothetical protein